MTGRRRFGSMMAMVLVLLLSCRPAASSNTPLDAIPQQLTLSVPTDVAPNACTSIATSTSLATITLPQSFADDFSGSQLDPTRWTMNYASNYWWVYGTRTLPGNQEQEIYVDPAYPGRAGPGGTPLGLNPFVLQGGVLSIVAHRTPQKLLNALFNYPYYSGAMTTAQTFNQQYGYFEARMQLPTGPALWPAFWLLEESANNVWPPEIDVMEQLGKAPTQIYTTGHYQSTSGAGPAQSGCATQNANAVTAFTDYGVLIEPDRVVWYVDRVPVSEMATEPGFDASFYMLLNLAVGGTWPGSVTAQTPNQASLKVTHVVAYSLP